MALTRAMLKGMELTDEQVSAIIEEHTSVTNALKEQRDEFKKGVDELANVKKELKDIKEEYAEFKNSVEKDNWQQKFEEEHEQFEKYKSSIIEKETSNKLRDAYKKLLTECKVGSKHIDSILKVTDFKSMKLKEDGTLDNADTLKESISKDWSGFITSESTKGGNIDNPPSAGAGSEPQTGRAATLAAKYHENLYGKKED